jgi:RNA polymerase sigma-70 factor (ECF subfamily)
MAIFRRSDPTHQAGAALAELYREHANATYRFAVHMCGSRDDAEDLVQIAFLEAHRRLLAGETLMNPRAWLARVVRTRALNLRRDRHDIAAGDTIEEVAGAARPVELSDELARVRAVLAALPESQHQAFVLRHWCDLPNSEIAEVLGTSESAVESLLVRARRAVAGAEELPADCLAFRDRLARGLPETIALQQHRSRCSGCRTAAERVSQAAAVAAVVALAPRPSVAHALAASVHGFTIATATSTGTGVAGAAAAKTAAAKVLIAAVAVTGTVAAVHTGVVPVPALLRPHHHSLVGTVRPLPADVSTGGSGVADADRVRLIPIAADQDHREADPTTHRHGDRTSSTGGHEGSGSQQDGGSQGGGGADDQGSQDGGSTGNDGTTSGDSGQQDQGSSGDSSGSGSNNQGSSSVDGSNSSSGNGQN